MVPESDMSRLGWVRPECRAVVVVTQREGIGQRVVEGQIGSLVVPHGEDAVDRSLEFVRGVCPDKVGVAMPPAQMLAPPAVVEIVGAFADT